MPKTRDVHRSARVADQRQVVSAPVKPAILTAAQTGPLRRGRDPAEADRGGLLHHVQIENIDPP
jgi:hypothetical protein